MKEDILDRPLEDLNLSVSAFCRIHKSGIRSIRQLTELTYADLQDRLQLRNKSILDVREKLSRLGLKLEEK